MSTPWSGRVCWAAVAALLINWASANPAIITSMTADGYYDVSLNISNINLMPGLASWDDLAFTSLQTPWFSTYNGSMETDMWEMLAVLDIASGTLCQNTDGCMDNITSYYQSLCDLESQESQEMVKRYLYIDKWISLAWKISSRHAVTGGALKTLSNTVASSTEDII